MTEDELNNIENYLNKTFKTNHFEVKKIYRRFMRNLFRGRIYRFNI